ncbi:MAG: hypothetical protein WAM82_04710 [Thermoanaerobaculia bacterium]
MEDSAELGAGSPSLPPHIIETLKWLVTTLGVTGILVILGFIDEFAYQDRLGYEFKTGDLSGYSVEAGRFLLATLLASLTWAVEHYLIALFLVAFLGGLGWAVRKFPAAMNSGTKIAVISALLALNLVIFDFPTVGLQQALILPITPPQNSSLAWPIGALTQRVWEHEICSRIDKTQFPILETMGGKCRERLPETHERIRKDRFAINALISLVLVFLFLSVLKEARSLPLSLMTAVVILGFMNLLMLPYVYAKTERSTFADSVEVTWAEAGVAARAGMNDSFFLLYQRGGEVALLGKNDGLIWKVPEKQVHLLRIVDRVDVISFLAKKRLVPATAPPP